MPDFSLPKRAPALAPRLSPPGLGPASAGPTPTTPPPVATHDGFDGSRGVRHGHGAAIAVATAELIAKADRAMFADDVRGAVSRMLTSATFTAASPERQLRILRLALALPALTSDASLLSYGQSSPFTTPLESFAALCASGRLASHASDGSGLLEILERVAATPLGSAAAPIFAPETHSNLLVALIEETASPARIDQGGASTCTVTSLSYELAQREPAEYARLVAGLVLDGQARMRSGRVLHFDTNGTERTVPSSSALRPKNDRTLSERALQSALMQAAWPRNDYRFDAASTSPDGKEQFHAKVINVMPDWARILAWIVFPVGFLLWLIPIRLAGLPAEQLADISGDVFGRRFETRGASLSGLREHLDAAGRPTAPLFVAFARFAGEAHALSVVAIEGEGDDASIICRNPWGSIWVDLAGQSMAEAYAGLWESLPEGARPDAATLAGVSFADSRQGTIRVPLRSPLGQSLSGFVTVRS